MSEASDAPVVDTGPGAGGLRRRHLGRQARGWPWKSIQAGSGHLPIGSDWPVASLDPLVGAWVGPGRADHGSVPNQRLSLAEMIDGYTSGAAYASFDEDRKGRLAIGQLADIAC